MQGSMKDNARSTKDNARSTKDNARSMKDQKSMQESMKDQKSMQESMKDNAKKDRKDIAKKDRIKDRQRKDSNMHNNEIDNTDSIFSNLNLSPQTLQGLQKHSYTAMTLIQKDSLPHSLMGSDVLGAAKTGSGKTLAFIIPILETLNKQNYSHHDGLGALVISPTRELALQTFHVLRNVGAFHSFSAGLLIGGKDVKQEKERVSRMNILITTPGRLLQHLDESPEFDCNSLQILVLDEADRILDQGFQKTLNAILEHLPRERQTLLFSATQTKSVADLARLSLVDPVYVSVHEKADVSTPNNLQQKYMIIPLDQKLNVLFSFIKTHLKQKIIVFLSSCKQVRFVFEAFCKMQPGIQLMSLHGRQKQLKRMAVFQQFCKKTDACLFSTDIAARGLDFPAVDWVIQVDCPEDTETYIHRVGRTARYNAAGHGLLFVLPSEVEMINALQAKKVPITEIKANPAKTKTISHHLASLCSQDPSIKYLAQRAFVCYLRSIYLQKNKKIFNVEVMPNEAFAAALGLPGCPNIKFKNKPSTKNQVLAQTAVIEPKKPQTRIEKMFIKKNNTVLSEHYAKMVNNSSSDSEGDLLTLARTNHDVDDEIIIPKPLSKKQVAKKATLSSKIVFDDNGAVRMTKLGNRSI